MFSIIAAGDTTVDLDINPAATGANLDILATLYNASGGIVVSNNGTTVLNASINTTLPSGSYTLVIDGVGKGTPANGYSDYGSLGQYAITGTIETTALPCGTPFTGSGTRGDQHADFYYTPGTGRLVLASDDIFMQYIKVEGNEPGQVDFQPQFWNYNYFNGAAQWFLPPGLPAYDGTTRLATYDSGLDPAADFTCVEYGYTLIDDVNAQSLTGFADVTFDSSAPASSANLSNITIAGGTDYQFTVSYTDNVAVDYDTISDFDVQVTSNNGYSELAQLESATLNADGSIDAVYSIPANGGAWDAFDNGTYFFRTVANEVADLGGNTQDGGLLLDTLTVDIDPTCGTPFNNSGTRDDQHADFYYTPSTGTLVLDSDDLFMQYLKVEGAEPGQVNFQPQFWSYTYFNGAAQWFLPPGLPAYAGAASLATYARRIESCHGFPLRGIWLHTDRRCERAIVHWLCRRRHRCRGSHRHGERK